MGDVAEQSENQQLASRARALAMALEPFAGQVYFSPECHTGYQELGFGPSPGQFGGVAGPDGSAYFCSRGSVMGQVPGEVVAAAFGVFNPAVVVPLVDRGWSLTDASTISAARDRGAIAQLERILGPEPQGARRLSDLLDRAVGVLRPEGKPLFSGLLSQPLPASPLGRAWRQADRLREYRGDAHVAAWTCAGLDAAEIGLLTEPYWGLPLRTYVRTRSWTDADLDRAEAHLSELGYLADGTLTDAGRRARDHIESTTDWQCRAALDALGDDLGEVLSILGPWGHAIRDAKGYPASGPHDLARVARP
jgi:hypothetical protein